MRNEAEGNVFYFQLLKKYTLQEFFELTSNLKMSHEISYVRIQSVFKLRSYDMGISKCQVTHLFPGQTTFHIYYDDLRNLKNHAFLKKKKLK